MNVFWSDRLEDLAEGMFASWDGVSSDDPLSKTCVVVGDMATRDWLRRYFLLKRENGRRRIFSNIDFVPLAEFVNEWLAASTHANGAVGRNPSEHPYSQGVLVWRIYSILNGKTDGPDLDVLRKYVEGATPEVADRRRFDLAARLAKLYDDYLCSRYKMLVRWERGDVPSGSERWQAALYRMLVAEVPETYTSDFENALSDGIAAFRPFDNGFTRYDAVHVFDVQACPWPYMQMLARLSADIPVTFWNFNPSREYWLDDQTRKTAAKDLARRLMEALSRGENPPEAAFEPMFDTPDAKMLGALASGARGMLASELDIMDGDCEWLELGATADARPFDSLRKLDVEVHSCFSPRRELEAARDALHGFFDRNPSASPSDALVLCADWATYAPLIESVFATGGTDALPIAIGGAVSGDTPIIHSLGEIFDFRTNRFEASKVLHLLSIAQIRAKFGIDGDAFAGIREMIRSGNIRWGYDDDDVKAILGPDAKDEVRPFTWRRGLDRLVADALLGPRVDESKLVGLGALGRLLPCGGVEDDRAQWIARLYAFVKALADVRTFLNGSHGIETWRERLLKLIDDFYEPDDDTAREFAALRQAIMSVTSGAAIARACGGAANGLEHVPGDVMCRAVLSAVKSGTRGTVSYGDVVGFAELKSASAVPAKFVWICGLNDGSFPRTEYPAKFDLIGRHPTMFDVTSRERDELALLKAAEGAREYLGISYVGKDIRTNEVVPPSVPLMDLLDWFDSSDVTVTRYDHPLQPFSPRYFMEDAGDGLPPSYSSADYEVFASLASAASGGVDAALDVRPFEFADDGKTVIALDDLIAFFRGPNRFIARNRLRFRISRPQYDRIVDDDEMGAKVSDGFLSDVLLSGVGPSATDVAEEAERMVETGAAYDVDVAADALLNAVGEDAISDFQKRRIVFKKGTDEMAQYGCPDEDLPRRYLEFRQGEPVPARLPLTVDFSGADGVKSKRNVTLTMSLPPAVSLKNSSDVMVPHAFEFKYAPFKDDYPLAWITHLARHASGEQCVTVLLYVTKNPVTFRPVSKEEARTQLESIVSMAMAAFPFDMEKARCKDELPDEYAAAVGKYRVYRSTYRRSSR